MKLASGKISNRTLFLLALMGVACIIGIESSKQTVYAPNDEEKIVASPMEQSHKLDVGVADMFIEKRYNVPLTVLLLVVYVAIIYALTSGRFFIKKERSISS